MKRDTLEGDFSLDGGVLVELLSGTKMGGLVLEGLIDHTVSGYTSYFALTEAEYILCRRLGAGEAASKVDHFLRSNFVPIIETVTLHRRAAACKCERAISLADCYTLALAESTDTKALLAFREKELLREMKRKRFPVDILFLEEFSHP